MHHTLTKRIAVDMDEVMADTLTRWLECYNRDFGTTITKADFMIDDSEQNLAVFTGKGFIFSAPHNLLNDSFPRVNNWFDIADRFELARPERANPQL